MEFVKGIIEIIFHMDKHLDVIIKMCGPYSYLLLFVIIFIETGLVVMPFLPGDSLLFVVGTFAALGSFDLGWLLIVLAGAAIVGDSVNYFIGNILGQRLLAKGNSRFFKKEHVERTHKFFEKYGGKTILLARFVPIIRTFAPFVAGLGKMSYFKFFMYNVVGGLLWVFLFVLGGYYFGNVPFIKNNFFVTIIIVMVISVLPVGIEFLKQHKAEK